MKEDDGNGDDPNHFLHLSKYEWVHNLEVKNILKKKILTTIPKNWYSILVQLNTEDLNEVPFLADEGKEKYSEWPSSLHDFLRDSFQHSCTHDNNQEYQVTTSPISQDMARGMNPKKLHEVSRMASLIEDVVTKTDCNAIVDIGSGLGYLDHVLHQKYGFKILGMEIEQGHSSAAEKRAVQQGICCGGVRSIQCRVEDSPASYENFVDTVESMYRQLKDCQCGQRQSDEKKAEKSRECVDQSTPRVCLIGLHCCGDLSPTMMSYFSQCDYIKSICCVCCCYHKMTYSDSEKTFTKFPLSLEGKQMYRQAVEKHGQPFITPSTLRLGAQETKHRWRQQSQADHENHVNHVAFRGILSLTDEEDHSIRQRIRKCNFESIQTFIDSFYGSSPANVEKKAHFLTLCEQYKSQFDAIEVFTLLQVILQPVIESLLYEDRVQWLREQGFNKVSIVPVFDEFISPRNLAIVALKQ